MVVVTEIVDRGPKIKLFLGGWRNTVNGLVYYNACTQTHYNEVNATYTNDRETQIVEFVDVFTETNRDVAVQTSTMPDVRDKFIKVRASLVANGSKMKIEMGVRRRSKRRWKRQTRTKNEIPLPMQDVVMESAVKIQRFYRSYRDRVVRFERRIPRVKKSGEANAEIDDDEDEADDEEEVEEKEVDEGKEKEEDTWTVDVDAESRIRRSADFVILNGRPPNTRADFELLRNLLDRWRILETERANLSYFRASRIAVSASILSKEIELLRRIGSFKALAKRRLVEQRRRSYLEEMSRPVVWTSRNDNGHGNGKSILVDTQRTQKAREYRDAYESLLELEDSSQDDGSNLKKRVDLLLRVRDATITHTCALSSELLYLIDQEIDLLSCSIDVTRLDWLRQRLRFVYFLLARNSLGRNSNNDDRAYEICEHCGRPGLSDARCIEEVSGSFSPSSCARCRNARTRVEPHVVRAPYERMLRDIRRFEVAADNYDGIAFAVGVELVRRLVAVVWHGRSGISECDDPRRLRLVRFRKDVAWSPWNSLLLTVEEAAVHRALDDIARFYDDDLIRRFQAKNLQAKLYFGSVLRLGTVRFRGTERSGRPTCESYRRSS